ncbi:MAG TPA: toxin-antitoxin system YwqK family antitoxin [Cyclobacteriaceae bacterium]|nr:toxin-antitoxin system YwqK family antitoxin [Cyclobacteriaceae bacterium]
MKRIVCILFLMLVFTGTLLSQGFMLRSYHDAAKKNLKEEYQVKDTIHKVVHGRYASYYINGKLESKGQFTNDETTGVWEFYFESGNMKMRGALFKGASYGFWEYFYEDGSKSMEGIIYGSNKEGEWKTYYENGQIKDIGEYKNNKRQGTWKTYFEDGLIKGEAEYDEDYGRYIEYEHTGNVLGEGPKSGNKQVGKWRYFAEDGTLQSEGEFIDGKKSGEWVQYFSTGKVSSKGSFENGEPTGRWEYYFENGTVSASGEYLGGQKNGYWNSFTDNGILMSEVKYAMGTGEYREYHKSGKLKVKGNIVNNKKQGKWEFYFEGGELEGMCEFKDGKGTYHGYYPGGALQTKGVIDNNRKTGTWEIYDRDGKLSGYYKPFYDQQKIGHEVVAYEGPQVLIAKKKEARFTYFDARANEFRGVILGGNPVLVFAGRFPMGVEFYSQERLGHEFEFIGIRDPFFQKDENIAVGKQFQRGYTIAVKQKFYNPRKTGMWYFGHEIRFTNFGHFTNVAPTPDNIITISIPEQRMEYGVLFGYRLMQRNNSKGFTIDMFGSLDAGYRSVDMDPEYETYFANVNQSKFVSSVHVGLNIGNVFSAR